MKKKEEALKLLNLGIDEYKKDNFKLSSEYFKKAEKLFPNNIGILENLALSLYNQNEFSEAIAFLKKAISQEGNSQKAFDLLPKSLFIRPKIHIIDGTGHIWSPYSTKISESLFKPSPVTWINLEGLNHA